MPQPTVRPMLVAAAAFLAVTFARIAGAQAVPSPAPVPAALQSAADAPLAIHGNGRYTASADGRIYYEISGQGLVVILVSGGPGGSHDTYHGFFDRYLTGHTTVLFDNIGRGRSDRLKDPRRYTVPRDAEDIEALRKALGVDKIDVIGHSYGGMPALAYAVKYPEHVRHLILSDTLLNAHAFQENINNCNSEVAWCYPDVWAKLTAMHRSGVKTGSDQYEDLYGPTTNGLYWYDPKNAAKVFHSPDAADGFNSDVYLSMIGDDPEWTVGGTMRGYDPSGAARTRLAGVPVLVLAGRYDRVAGPKLAAEIKDALPAQTSFLRLFSRSGHRPWVEETDRYFAVVNAFLADRPLPPSEDAR